MAESRYETITYTREGAIATLTMNRPERMNAINNRMVIEATQALTAAAADPEVRVLVLTGAGRAFCPGADFEAIAGESAKAGPPLCADDFRAPVLLHEMPAVTIAAVNGACAGGALCWAAACDLRFASSAARFNAAFLDVAVAGDMGGPWTLPRLIGAARARDLYFLPGKFDAEEALRIGIVSRVFPEERFAAEVRAITERLAAAAPLALRTMKQNFVDAEKTSFADYVALETQRHLPLFETHHTQEAFRAKLEKRAPHFEGR